MNGIFYTRDGTPVTIAPSWVDAAVERYRTPTGDSHIDRRPVPCATIPPPVACDPKLLDGSGLGVRLTDENVAA